MSEKELDPQESLQVIHSMIKTARNRLANDGFLFIFWGWLVMGTALLQYYLILIRFPAHYLVWVLVSPVGIAVSVIYSIRHKQLVTVKTYIDRYLAYTWLGFMIGISFVLTYLPLHGMKITYFFAMLLYGIATFITGGIINFRPLIIGSLFSFLFAGISGLFRPEEQLLLVAGSMLCSYIIPGHMLRHAHYS